MRKLESAQAGSVVLVTFSFLECGRLSILLDKWMTCLCSLGRHFSLCLITFG
jgi:hypothetical protein